MQILILGHANDAHAAHVHAALLDRGMDVDYLDTQQFPSQICLAWRPDILAGILQLPGGKRISLQSIHSVYWRTFTGVRPPSLSNPENDRIAYHDAMSAMRSFLQLEHIHWVNSWEAYQFHQEKPRQLYTIQRCGIPIPATLITNDAASILAFAQQYPEAIFKPVYGGAHTQMLTSSHLEMERLNRVLSLSPVTIQAYVSGTNIRSYVIGERVYSAEIRSPSLDFREDSQADLIPLETPAHVQAQCHTIRAALKLAWTAIDWRLSPQGEFMFLEANPSPMFLYFEQKTGFPITQSLLDLLTAVAD